MRKIIKQVDPILLIGITISILISVILVFVGQDEVNSLLVGLVLTTITLIIDGFTRIKEVERNTIQALGLEESLTKYPFLFSTLFQIAKDYESVRNLEFDFFKHGADDVLLDCRNTIHSLAEQRIEVGLENNLAYGRQGIHDAQKSLKAVAYAEPSFWKTKYADFYLESNAQAVARGVKFTRIWLYDVKTLTEYQEILQRQVDVGIRVLIAYPDRVPDHILDDILLVDDKVLARLVLDANGKAKSQIVTIDPIEIEKAMQKFTLLERYSQTYSEFLDYMNKNKE
ncbi:MAG: hypothetical protein AB1894_17125 [Chloroflexota bacterium]